MHGRQQRAALLGYEGPALDGVTVYEQVVADHDGMGIKTARYANTPTQIKDDVGIEFV